MGLNGLKKTRIDMRKAESDTTIVVRAIKQRIATGRYRPGTWLSPQREMAEEFGVDRSAVRAALVSLAAEGVIEHRKGCRTLIRETNEWGPSRANHARISERIAAIVFNQEHFSGVQPLLKAASRRLEASGKKYDLIVVDTEATVSASVYERETSALAELEQGNMAGALMWHNGGEQTVPHVLAALSAGSPIVFVDRFIESIPCDFVGVDDWQMIMDSVQYLYSLGHRRIGYMSVEDFATTTKLRAQGYTDAMEEIVGAQNQNLGYLWNCDPTDLSLSVQAGIEHFLSMKDPPTAILASNDFTAFYLMNELDARGIAVPADISVMGCDDLERFLPTPHRLTTMHIPFGRIGQRAAELLLNRLASPGSQTAPRQHILLAARLVERVTCRKL